MAKAKNTKKNNDFNFEFKNNVVINGKIVKIVYSGENVSIYNVDVPSKTPKGNVAHTWVNIVDFNREMDFEENDAITVTGELQTNTYDGKDGKVYQLRIVANSIDTIDEFPFN